LRRREGPADNPEMTHETRPAREGVSTAQELGEIKAHLGG
jgi:hypothetical protein